MVTRRISVGRLLFLPIPYAAVIGLLRAEEAKAPNLWIETGWASDVWGMIGATVIAVILVSYRNGPELWFALLGIGCGVGVGATMMAPCTEIGIFVGPLLGFLIVYLGEVIRDMVEKRGRGLTSSRGDESIRWLDDLDAATPLAGKARPQTSLERGR